MLKFSGNFFFIILSFYALLYGCGYKNLFQNIIAYFINEKENPRLLA